MGKYINDELILKFDLNTIEHLGVKMYKTLPPVLAELISNAYDADATWVDIKLYDEGSEKQIIITDNGYGMSFDEINDSFLVIGKNRRKGTENDMGITPQGRKVTGRKGLGKLATFGITSKIEIQTIKEGFLNIFSMDLEDILNENNNGIYKPTIIKRNEPTEKSSGTQIILSRIKRESPFNIENIEEAIAKRFDFQAEDFYINLSKNKDKEIKITKQTKWKYVEGQFEWVFDTLTCPDDDFLKSNNITGKIVTTQRPLPESQRGLFLYARGKLVNSNEFYGVKATSSLAYNYMTGILQVDFIDDSLIDYITTNRDGLIWEREELKHLKEWIQTQLQNIEKQWSAKRTKLKEEEIEKTTGYKPSDWIETLPKRKQKLAQSWLSSIYKDNSIGTEKAGELINHLQLCLKFDTFEDLVTELDNSGLDEVKVLELFKEWQMVEAQELYNLSKGRIKAIEKLEQFIKEDAKEVPIMHNFIKQFPWILDPKMTIYKDECKYSDLLKEKFPEDDIEIEKDRRLDFLCTGFGDTLYIVELKRPSCKISDKELTQLREYHTFIENNYIGTSESSYTQVASYIIAGATVSTPSFKKYAEGMKSQRMYIELYPAILSRVKNYHEEFIEKYKEFK
ncbi:ATP-binding protein [bacterium]|nr:ATP-binding protein [bacterium]